MSDDTQLNLGAGGDLISTDDIGGGVKVQRNKMQFGVDGSAVDVSAINPLPVDADFISSIGMAEGAFAGYSTVQKFGFNTDVDADVMEDIWSYGGDYNWLDTATQLEVLSASADDAAAGTGARTVQIWGLDASHNEQTEVVTMDGTTPVATAGTYIRLHRMKGITPGSGGTAAGLITCRIVGGGVTVAEIPLPHNQTEMAVYTVPAGKTAYIFGIWGSATDTLAKADIGIMMRVREFGEMFCTKFNMKLATDGTCAAYRDLRYTPIKCLEKSDIIMRTLSSENNTTVVGAFDLVLKDD